MKPYKDTRIALEKKSEEFKKSGEILYKLEKPHLNSAVGRYYYIYQNYAFIKFVRFQTE